MSDKAVTTILPSTSNITWQLNPQFNITPNQKALDHLLPVILLYDPAMDNPSGYNATVPPRPALKQDAEETSSPRSAPKGTLRAHLAHPHSDPDSCLYSRASRRRDDSTSACPRQSTAPKEVHCWPRKAPHRSLQR